MPVKNSLKAQEGVPVRPAPRPEMEPPPVKRPPRRRQGAALRVSINRRTRLMLQALSVMGYGSSPAVIASTLLRRSVERLQADLRRLSLQSLPGDESPA